MEQELLAVLLSAAISLSGLPPMEVHELPAIQRVSHDDMKQAVCPRDPDSCKGIAAVFDSDRQRIFIDETLNMDLADDNSFVVHELVHVLQFRQRGSRMYANCTESVNTETQAYQVQNAYLKREGRLVRFYQRLAFASCSRAGRVF
jgi:hypothetical protein